MSEFGGIVNAGLQLGLASIVVKPKRSIGPFTAQVTIRETHHDGLEITEHPVEQGASVADHAYKKPAELVIECGWSNSPSVPGLIDGIVGGLRATVSGVQSIITGNSASSVRDIYARMLKLQVDRVPMDVSTGKRNYRNMLIKDMTQITDKEHENSLLLTIVLRQIIVVTTQTINVSAPPERQADPAATAPVTNMGTKSLVPATQFNAAGGGRGF